MLANVNQHVGVRTQLCDSDGRFERSLLGQNPRGLFILYLIKMKGSGFKLKWKQVKDMTTETFTKLMNVDTDYSIAIVDK